MPTFPTTFTDGDAPVSTRPLICYRYSGPAGGSYGTPTFAPDGSRVAWAESDGIKVVNVPASPVAARPTARRRTRRC